MLVCLHLSTLTTLIQYVVYKTSFVSFDTHDILSFASNFLNNGPIFNPIRPLELSQSEIVFV